jgi:hypothetical protein
MSKVLDLDILRPAPAMVKLGGKTHDVSYIPCGITFDIDQIVRELSTIKESEVGVSDEETKKAFDLTIRLCVAFVQYKYPEMDDKWFLDNVSPNQVRAFADAIKTALIKSYEGLDEYGKN